MHAARGDARRSAFARIMRNSRLPPAAEGETI
jgi:hypothetical protein